PRPPDHPPAEVRIVQVDRLEIVPQVSVRDVAQPEPLDAPSRRGLVDGLDETLTDVDAGIRAQGGDALLEHVAGALILVDVEGEQLGPALVLDPPRHRDCHQREPGEAEQQLGCELHWVSSLPYVGLPPNPAPGPRQVSPRMTEHPAWSAAWL